MKPTILLLGTVHLANPDNGDAFKAKVEGLQTERRQLELKEVIHRLKEYKPTKIAVESKMERQEQLKEEYLEFLDGSFTLTDSEIHQIGFRLAERMELPELHAIDWNERRSEGVNPWEWAEKHQPELLAEIEALVKGMMEDFNEKYSHSTIRETLLWLNSSDYTTKDQELYMKMALIGNDENPAGIQWLSDYWVYRNLRIYKNIVKLAETSDDRILVLYGVGHLSLLSRYIEESGLFTIEKVRKYLG